MLAALAILGFIAYMGVALDLSLEGVVGLFTAVGIVLLLITTYTGFEGLGVRRRSHRGWRWRYVKADPQATLLARRRLRPRGLAPSAG